MFGYFSRPVKKVTQEILENLPELSQFTQFIVPISNIKICFCMLGFYVFLRNSEIYNPAREQRIDRLSNPFVNILNTPVLGHSGIYLPVNVESGLLLCNSISRKYTSIKSLGLLLSIVFLCSLMEFCKSSRNEIKIYYDQAPRLTSSVTVIMYILYLC